MVVSPVDDYALTEKGIFEDCSSIFFLTFLEFFPNLLISHPTLEIPIDFFKVPSTSCCPNNFPMRFVYFLV